MGDTDIPSTSHTATIVPTATATSAVISLSFRYNVWLVLNMHSQSHNSHIHFVDGTRLLYAAEVVQVFLSPRLEAVLVVIEV